MPNDPYAVEEIPANDQEPMEQGSGGESATDGETALLPKSIFKDKNLEPGTKCTFEIVRAHEDEVEVKYSKEEEAPAPRMGIEAGLDQIAKPYGGL